MRKHEIKIKKMDQAHELKMEMAKAIPQQMKREKIALERQKIELEHRKIELEH